MTAINSDFFYNDYSVKYFITLNKLISIKTAKNIVMFINNNTFTYGLTDNIKPGSTEPSTTRHGNKGKNTTYFYNNNNDNNNPPSLLEFVVNINFLNCYFNDDG